jgi:lauroyl/myristoyl acyltransferase
LLAANGPFHSRLDAVAMMLASARGRLRWRGPRAREQSRRAMDAILGPAAVPDGLARDHLAHHAVREEFIRRPWMVRGMPVEGVEHLQRAHATGRGVLLSYCHLGPFPGLGVTAAEHAGNVHQVALAWLANPRPDPSQLTRWQAWRSMFTAAGVPLIAANGCFPVVQELLSRGAVVVMAFDWPGSAESMFLGRPVALASGTARLSHMTGALVVPVMRYLHRWRPRTAFGPPIDPARHAGWPDVHVAVAARHEQWILDRPAALEDPRRTAAWEASATALRWGAPPAAEQAPPAAEQAHRAA